MFSHIMIGTADIEKAREFYTPVLGVLGAGEPQPHVNATGQKRLFYIHNHSIFCLTQPIDNEPPSVANGSTIGFTCDSPEQIQEFHDVAIAHGATTIEKPPGLRDDSMGKIYLCYFRDLDGHKICGLHRPK